MRLIGVSKLGGSAQLGVDYFITVVKMRGFMSSVELFWSRYSMSYLCGKEFAELGL